MLAKTAFEQALRARLQRQPFQPFVIEFDDSDQWLVEKREALFYHAGDSAMLFHADGSFDFVDADNVKQFLDVAAAPSP